MLPQNLKRQKPNRNKQFWIKLLQINNMIKEKQELLKGMYYG